MGDDNFVRNNTFRKTKLTFNDVDNDTDGDVIHTQWG